MKSVRFNPLASLVTAVALTIGLAACGGSSKKPPEPTAEEQCVADGGRWNADETCTSAEDVAKEALAAKQKMQREAIATAIDKAETAVAAVDNDSTDAEVTAAENAITAATNAIAAAADVPAAEKTANTGTVTALTNRLTDAKADRKAAMDDAAQDAMKEATARANAISTALGTHAVVGSQTGEITAVTVTAERDSSGTTVEITGGSDTEDYKSSSATVPAVSGWHGEMQTRGGTGTTPLEEVTAYTDIAAGTSKSVLFATAYAAAVTGKTSGDVSGGRHPVVAAPIKNLVRSSDFPSGSRMRYTYGTGDDDQADASEGITGTFEGVAGKFYCSSGCAVQTNADGQIESLGDSDGNWTFDPDSDTAKVNQVTQDDNYLYFGWWLETTKGASSNTHRFHSFSGGSEAYADDAMQALTGKAKYQGPAAGLWVTENVVAGGLTSAESGTFTATAKLEADFGAIDANGTVKGEVTDFMAGGASKDWMVTLKSVTLPDNNNVFAGTAGTSAEATIGEAESTSGSWNGAFFGAPATGVTTGDAAHPTGLAGEFDVEFGSAHISGAFGANLQ